MALILESDIIYNVLPHTGFPTIRKLLCVNKFVNKLCNDVHFWKAKLKNDYKNVIPKSDKWMQEYKCIYKIHIRSIKFVNNFIIEGMSYITPSYHVHVHELINLDHFRWIPNISKLKLGSQATTSLYYINYKVNKFTIVFKITIHGTMEHTLCALSRDEFTNYMINLHYNHDCIHMSEYNNKKIIFF